MVRARWIGGRRFKQARHRPKPLTCCSMTKPPRRCWTAKQQTAGNFVTVTEPAQAGNGHDLLVELKALVRKEPKNLLQELKHLVTKFTKLEAQPKQAVDREWATVARVKPKQQRCPSEWAPARPAVNLSSQLPGKLRDEDWKSKIAETLDQLEEILKTETSVVLAPFKNADVADMWAMLPEAFPVQELLTSLDSSRLVVASVRQGAITLPKVRFLEDGGGNAPKFERIEVPVRTRDNSSTVVLRASTHRDVVLDFGKMQCNPGSFVRSWIQCSKSCPITSVGDTWDWLEPLRSNCQWCYVSCFESGVKSTESKGTEAFTSQVVL